MASFAKSTFNASSYSSFRPTYPHRLFEDIFRYHRRAKSARWDFAVDLGCGTGQATARLNTFEQVLGIDPSQPMVEAARELNARKGLWAMEHIHYVQGEAENLSGIVADDSVDMIISAQAAHWFDWNKVWPETSRVLRAGGTAAFWVYSEFRLTGYPSVTPIIAAYAQGTDPKTSLGPYFQRPGRTILENHLVDVPEPGTGSGLGDFERVFYTGTQYSTFPMSQTRPVEMRAKMRWSDLLGYFRTWSALDTFHERFPEDLQKIDNRFPEDLEPTSDSAGRLTLGSDAEGIDLRGGDIAVRFWKDLREGVRNGGGAVGVNDDVTVEWPIALLLVRKL